MKIRKSKAEMSLLISSLKNRGYGQFSYTKTGTTETLVLRKLVAGELKQIMIKMSVNGWTEVL